MRRVDIAGTGIVSPAALSYAELVAFIDADKSIVKCEEAANMVCALLKEFDFLTELAQIALPADISNKAKKLALRQSLSTQTAIIAALQAWVEAGMQLGHNKPERVSLIIAGDNFNQREMAQYHDNWRANNKISPSYALKFMDSNLLGIISELLSIKGEGFTIGAASASGNAGIIAGARQIEHDYADVCLVVAPMMELSAPELHAFANLGVLAENHSLYGPFDQRRSGFFYGQASAAMLLKKTTTEHKGAIIKGYSFNLDANSGASPSLDAEVEVMCKAIQHAGLKASGIKHISAHGSGSIIGDEIELQAIQQVFTTPVKLNSAKSMLGHCLSSAGMVESIIAIAQLQQNFFHRNFHLTKPISTHKNLSICTSLQREQSLEVILKNSFGFSGINSCIIYAKV